MDQAEVASSDKSPLYTPADDAQSPIVYHSSYNISFMGLQKLHPFDAGKWGRIVDFICQPPPQGFMKREFIVEPLEASEEDLLRVHTKDYLQSLKSSRTVAMVTEVPPVALLPNFIVQRSVLRPFRFHVGGTVLAGRLALTNGWSLNIGGGFHHCCASRGGGFCAYADITMAIRFLQRGLAGDRLSISKAMIIDLDAHQGNGHERDFMRDDSVFILDAYNYQIYPMDSHAAAGIDKSVRFKCGTGDDEYLSRVSAAIDESLEKFTPDLVVYNAGTDIMEGDGLGRMDITARGIIQRDELVMSACKSRKLPVVMVTSGGYQRSNARVIADSLLNLHDKGIIQV